MRRAAHGHGPGLGFTDLTRLGRVYPPIYGLTQNERIQLGQLGAILQQQGTAMRLITFIKSFAAAAAVAVTFAPQLSSAQTINILGQTVDIGAINGTNVSGTVVGPGPVTFTTGSSLQYSDGPPTPYSPTIIPGTAVEVTVSGTLNTASATFTSSIFQSYELGSGSAASAGGAPVPFFIQYFAVYSVPNATNPFSLSGGNVTINVATIRAVPGPIAGAGIPALLALGGIWYARRRRAAAI
jgi:hypothetical protein